MNNIENKTTLGPIQEFIYASVLLFCGAICGIVLCLAYMS